MTPSIIGQLRVLCGMDLATGPDATGYAVTNSAGECIASGDYAMLSDFDHDLLFGSGHPIGGLLGYLSGGSRPTPPGTMTRQRRRAEARAKGKIA